MDDAFLPPSIRYIYCRNYTTGVIMAIEKVGRKENEQIPVLVHSHDRKHPMRANGRGFSRKEIKSAKLTIRAVRKYDIPVDLRRESEYPENVEILEKTWKVREEEELAKLERAVLREVATKKERKKTKEVSLPAAPEEEDWMNKCPFCGNEYKALSRHKCSDMPEGDARYSLDLLPITEAQMKKIQDLGVSDLKALETEDAEEIAGILKIDANTVKKWISYAETINKMS